MVMSCIHPIRRWYCLVTGWCGGGSEDSGAYKVRLGRREWTLWTTSVFFVVFIKMVNVWLVGDLVFLAFGNVCLPVQIWISVVAHEIPHNQLGPTDWGFYTHTIYILWWSSGSQTFPGFRISTLLMLFVSWRGERTLINRCLCCWYINWISGSPAGSLSCPASCPQHTSSTQAIYISHLRINSVNIPVSEWTLGLTVVADWNLGWPYIFQVLWAGQCKYLACINYSSLTQINTFCNNTNKDTLLYLYKVKPLAISVLKVHSVTSPLEATYLQSSYGLLQFYTSWPIWPRFKLVYSTQIH